ncbi:MAG: chorismate synthase [Rhodospirillales bacterium]
MSHNTFGHLFRVTTWGESHGAAIGCVVDGCPPGILLSESDIQPFLDRRRPGQSKFTTQRAEPDEVRILSGVYDGRTTGTPIALQIENVDRRSKDYDSIADMFRPGHADIAYELKYGTRDPRGGGRSSARETAMRVAAGAVAPPAARRRRAHPRRPGTNGRPRDRPHPLGLGRSGEKPVLLPDAQTAALWETYLAGIRREGSSVGAVIEVVADGVPPGLGAPIYGKLDADLAAAMMSINAVKGVEIGDGFATAALRGEQNADAMRMDANRVRFASNHAGGVLGGISTGQPVVARFAVKPTSSILVPVPSVTRTGAEVEITTGGRHDPCVGIRAVPVGEAMMACVLADHLLRHRAQNPDAPAEAVLPPYRHNR